MEQIVGEQLAPDRLNIALDAGWRRLRCYLRGSEYMES